MSSYRLILLAATCAAIATPLSSQAAPDPATTAASCTAPSMTMTERRMTEKAAGGMPALIAFVHLTAPIYQVTVVRRSRDGRDPARAQGRVHDGSSARANTD